MSSKSIQPEALMQLADAYAEALFDQGLHRRAVDDAPENARSVLEAAIRSQHSRIEELEAQLEALGSIEPGRDWLPIESAPIGRDMFIVRAFDVQVTDKSFNYTSDAYVVWQPSPGEFVRWPHPFKPTHWSALPPKPAITHTGCKKK